MEGRAMKGEDLNAAGRLFVCFMMGRLKPDKISAFQAGLTHLPFCLSFSRLSEVGQGMVFCIKDAGGCSKGIANLSLPNAYTLPYIYIYISGVKSHTFLLLD